MNQESPNPFVNLLFAFLAVGGVGSWIVSNVSQIEQGWRILNLLLGSLASIAALIYWIKKGK